MAVHSVQTDTFSISDNDVNISLTISNMNKNNDNDDTSTWQCDGLIEITNDFSTYLNEIISPSKHTPDVPANYKCFKCKQVGDHWIMNCDKSASKLKLLFSDLHTKAQEVHAFDKNWCFNLVFGYIKIIPLSIPIEIIETCYMYFTITGDLQHNFNYIKQTLTSDKKEMSDNDYQQPLPIYNSPINMSNTNIKRNPYLLETQIGQTHDTFVHQYYMIKQMSNNTATATYECKYWKKDNPDVKHAGIGKFIKDDIVYERVHGFYMEKKFNTVPHSNPPKDVYEIDPHESLCYGECTPAIGIVLYKYIEGMDLYTFIKRFRLKVTAQHIGIIGKKIFEYIDGINTIKLCHRDLAPTNVIISFKNIDTIINNPQLLEVTVIDIESAKLLDDKEENNTSGTCLNQAPYRSPEIRDFNRFNERSDIYSVGGIIYYCLTGQKPTSRDLKLKGDYNNVLQHMVEKMTQIDAYKRPTAAELLADKKFNDLCIGNNDQDITNETQLQDSMDISDQNMDTNVENTMELYDNSESQSENTECSQTNNESTDNNKENINPKRKMNKNEKWKVNRISFSDDNNSESDKEEIELKDKENKNKKTGQQKRKFNFSPKDVLSTVFIKIGQNKIQGWIVDINDKQILIKYKEDSKKTFTEKWYKKTNKNIKLFN